MELPNLRDSNVQDRLRGFLGERHSRNLVFVGGSLVEGFGNSMSDIDIISISDEEPSASGYPDSQMITDGHTLELSMFEGRRIDTEILSRARVEEVIRSMRQSDRHPGSLTTAESTLLNNIYVGLPIVRDADALEWRESLDWESWRETLLKACNLRYRGSSEDAQGAIDSGNWWAAHYSSLGALDASVDALIIAAGSMSVRGKWRIDYFSQLGMEQLGAEYWQLVSDAGIAPADVLKRAKKRLMVAQRWTYQAGAGV